MLSAKHATSAQNLVTSRQLVPFRREHSTRVTREYLLVPQTLAELSLSKGGRRDFEAFAYNVLPLAIWNMARGWMLRAGRWIAVGATKTYGAFTADAKISSRDARPCPFPSRFPRLHIWVTDSI